MKFYAAYKNNKIITETFANQVHTWASPVLFDDMDTAKALHSDVREVQIIEVEKDTK
jgi:hypothetical protein